MSDDFTGEKIDNFNIVESHGKGGIGTVYRAERIGNIQEVRAIKLIDNDSLRPQWENEITKVLGLQFTPGVVRYHNHGTHNFQNKKDYVWISWDFIPGKSLRELIERKEITIPLVASVVERTLGVLHACSRLNIQHGDLHAGNILIQDENPLNLDSNVREVWITDFGYCTASIGLDMLDDFLGLSRIIGECIKVINFHELGGKDKQVFRVLKRDFPRYLIETNQIEGDYVRNPRLLLEKFHDLCAPTLPKSIRQEKHIADYLAAEHIGERFDEWKELFVPEFIASSSILDRNIAVITGLRGCGKTTIFRRLTALYDLHLGPSGVPRSDTFIGFYLNARSIAEAFPWLPENQEVQARNQVIHYFHLSWCLEILDWLEKEAITHHLELSWLYKFFKKNISTEIPKTTPNYLANIRSILNKELDNSKLQSGYNSDRWDLTSLTFLEEFANEISLNCKFVFDKPYYFFLDDYSTPLITPETQRILNAIVFRRSSSVIFKIATESVESFVPVGLNTKLLEEKDDYVLIDFGMETLLTDEAKNIKLLSAIIGPRIDRNKNFHARGLSIADILGKTEYTNVDLANFISNDADKEKVEYHGIASFSSMWSSDIREMISIFANMVSHEKEAVLKNGGSDNRFVGKKTQNKVMREAGSKFLSLLESATNPSEKIFEIENHDKSFGEHLVKIARSFQQIALHDLKTKTSKNGKSNPPKQARKIEITEVGKELPGKIRDYYKGIIRYGLFTRDTRGKSVRNKPVPRLYLRGLLIPYFTLTFSKRDNISMSWENFCRFLEHPEEFAKYWIEQSKTPKPKPPQNCPAQRLPGME